MNSAIDQVVTEVSREFVQRLGALNADPYIREAVMKLAIREISWAMLETFNDKYTLAEQLELMGEIIKAHEDED
jgi:hypothetical protein